MAENSQFYECIKRVFDGWTVIRLAVEHDFRGDGASREVADWMLGALQQWFNENKNVDAYEVEEVLATMLTEDLNTVADDGSLPQIAAHICGCHRMLREGRQADLEAFLARLPRAQVSQCVARHDESSSEDDEEMAEAGSSHGGACNYPSSRSSAAQSHTAASDDSTAMDDVEMENDGWTTVSKKVKKR